jgi:peptidoglycan/LPS O-acetylase OafA/YrhL
MATDGARGTTGQPPGEAPQVSQAGEQRLARIEALRAMAALAVCTAHPWGLAHSNGPGASETFFGRLIYGGGFGVYLFFGLSGYLLFWPFVRHYWGGGARIDTKRYALNRFVRIMPLYWTVVIVLLLLQENGGTGEQWWRFMLLWENFSHGSIHTVDGVLWSLVVEVHFYILLPFLAAGIAWFAKGSRASAAVVLLGLGAASLLLWIDKVTLPAKIDPVWWHNIPATFFFFVPGMLLGLVRLEVEERRPDWLKGRAGSSGVWLALAIATWIAVYYWWFDWVPLITVASFLAIGACVLPLRDSALRRALEWRPLVAVGVVSYSLYVWHTRIQVNLYEWDAFPHTALAIMAVGIPLAIAGAFISYWVVEAPFLRLRRRWSDASAPIPEEPLPAAAPDPAPAG